jgi:hypothetical protein
MAQNQCEDIWFTHLTDRCYEPVTKRQDLLRRAQVRYQQQSLASACAILFTYARAMHPTAYLSIRAVSRFIAMDITGYPLPSSPVQGAMRGSSD